MAIWPQWARSFQVYSRGLQKEGLTWGHVIEGVSFLHRGHSLALVARIWPLVGPQDQLQLVLIQKSLPATTKAAVSQPHSFGSAVQIGVIDPIRDYKPQSSHQIPQTLGAKSKLLYDCEIKEHSKCGWQHAFQHSLHKKQPGRHELQETRTGNLMPDIPRIEEGLSIYLYYYMRGVTWVISGPKVRPTPRVVL